MTILFDVILETARLLKTLREGVATGGTTTTLVDSLVTEPDEFFKGGTIFIKSGDNANLSKLLSDYDLTTTTFSFSAFANAIAAGVLYAVSTPDYPRENLIESVNLALRHIGAVPQYDIFTISETELEEYTLPTGIQNIKRLEISSADEDPFGWKDHYFWRELGGNIVFTKVPVGNYARIWYEAPNSVVSDDDDTISSAIPLIRLAWTAAYYAIYQRLQRVENDDPTLGNSLREAKDKMESMLLSHPIYKLPTQPILGGWL